MWLFMYAFFLRKTDIETYEKINNDAFFSVYTGLYYTEDCMKNRNEYMVDNSSFCIAYLKRASSGTKHTVNYAKKNSLCVVNVADYINNTNT